MSIEFQEERFSSAYSGIPGQEDAGSTLGNWLIRNGLAKDAASANIILIIVAIVIFAISIYFWIFGFSGPGSNDNQVLPDTIIEEPLNS